ncbi:hypothetical protein HR059_13055 [Sinorhizobium meliloti WSM1022]|jgi:hypothetical protein|uniref:Transmembrane protein n=2 Tax=Sinorhizobium TaxID=28105 RepID=H0FWZ6_RHIML|nr:MULTISPECIES: hypothetical protein [Sinorhizobium]ASQ03022.1 hypothetical protein CDO23_03115 [Sinorhizobium meliloti]EHK78336.1 hypothetical protein SM0020_08558 [Sinorhizobium meliloti CCNWSX0020]MCO6425277.1 hypothetical protein [Sinorhizobium meliloti]MDW9411275.1 hypothetical protein [Sinorhizobium meliloti]MDW9416187.1 hypothetical protein [Sinorhizobium meliloti]
MQAFRAKTAGIDLIPPERASRSSAAQPRRLDYIDVEFETVAPTARRSPYPVFNDNRRAGARQKANAAAAPGLRSAARRILVAAGTRLDAMSPRRFAGLAAFLGLTVFLLIAGFGGDGRADMHPLPTKGGKMPDLTVSFAEDGASDR